MFDVIENESKKMKGQGKIKIEEKEKKIEFSLFLGTRETKKKIKKK